VSLLLNGDWFHHLVIGQSCAVEWNVIGLTDSKKPAGPRYGVFGIVEIWTLVFAKLFGNLLPYGLFKTVGVRGIPKVLE
jgi:hypothetical protein